MESLVPFKREPGTNAREKLYLGYITERCIILCPLVSAIVISLYYFIF